MKADPKPAKRIRNRDVYAEFHMLGLSCLACTWNRRVEAYHLLSRAQGGDDVMDNLVPLCQSCHRAYHNANQNPRRNVAKFLRSNAGAGHRGYLSLKLGLGGRDLFIERLER